MVSVSNKMKLLDAMDSLKTDNYIASISSLCFTLFQSY